MLNYQAKILSLCVATVLFLLSFVSAQAAGEVLGMHVLHPDEVKSVRRLYEDEVWRYLTIPLTLEDTKSWTTWQNFFDEAARQRIIPIIRLTTSYDPVADAWKIPSRKEITTLVAFLSSLNWHQNEKFVIVFNEVNHAKEWGGRIDPLSYAEALKFTSQWLHSEGLNYKVLPAAMDLAANNSRDTMEAFNYLDRLHQIDPEIFSYVDYWNSHSYPNPDFAASPTRLGQNSLRGFIYELNYLKNKMGRDFQVFITETGWASSYLTNYYLDDYYLYALQHIWSDDRVKAVTPFLMKGSPGPFASFSFFDAQDNPTVQFFALKKALKDLAS